MKMNEDQNPMTEQPSKSKAKHEDAKVNMTVSEITALVNDAVARARSEDANATNEVLKQLTQAIQDSRKPYKDPKAEENDALMRAQMKDVNKRIALNIKASQANCPHFQGSNELSDFQGALTSIVKHYTDTGVAWGICTNCLRQFWPGDPDYMKEMQRKSGNRPSAAGRRWFSDPAAAAQASMPKKQDRDDLVAVPA